MKEENIRVFQAFAATLDQLQSMHAAVLLRPKDLSIETAFAGDYDLLFDPDRFSEVLAISVRHCRHHRVSMILDQRKTYLRRVFFISDEDADERITLELWPHAEMTLPGRFLRATATVDWDSARPFLVSDNAYLALKPAVAAAIYITHLHHKSKPLDSPEVRRRLAIYKDVLSQTADEVHADLSAIIDSLRVPSADLKKANIQAYSILLRIGVCVRIRRVSPLMQRTRHRLARLLGANGRFAPVPFIGPDGSGKTAIISALADQEHLPTFKFKKIFRMSLPYRSYHFLTRKFGGSTYYRNLVDESIVHLVLATSIVRWWWLAKTRALRAYRRRGATGMTLVDRYFWDYLLRLRHAETMPARISGYRLFSKLVPTPDCAVVLCCSCEIIHSRKKELTSAAIDYLYELYWDQIARKKVPRVLMLSTDGPFERSYRQVAQFLLPDRAPRLSGAADRGQAWTASANAGPVGEGRATAQRASGVGA